ncbi:NAD(P)H-binding protein [Micromonospora sp. NPDC007271]|uniref:NAD(P)-dependent oxidoreductase n=1 Tax=Micromonospora sp. NPDC007271 TaxID=3154587 RepID=UPI0033D01A28
MKVLVFGASGSTGRRLVDAAVGRRHSVTAFVRNPAAFQNGQGIEVFRGDVADRHAVARAMPGQAAVLCVLGAATPLRRDPTLVAGVRHITEAMVDAGVRRLVYLSFLGVPAGRHQLSALGRIVVAPVLLRKVAADHAEKEEIIQRSGLDWTIVRPPRLTNGPRTGTYRHGEAIHASQIVLRISRADIVDFMLRQLDDLTYLHRAPAVMP